jgi:hypothetical protein
MNNQIHSLSNQIYNIKDKITDLEYYNLMQTLSLLMKIKDDSIIKYQPPAPSWSYESSNHSSEHIEESVASSNSSSHIDY